VAAFAVGSIALAASAFHLGRPIHALRALRAWRRSWLSREAITFGAYWALGGAAAALALAGGGGWCMLLLAVTVLAGVAGIASSAGIYLLPARPAWNTWRTPAQFAFTALSLGSLGALLALEASGGPGDGPSALTWILLGVGLLATLLQVLVPWTLVAAGPAETGSAWRRTAILLTRHCGRLLWLKTAAGAAAAFLAIAGAVAGAAAAMCLAAALAAALLAEIAGRYLFFVTVVPRNMPGHFFTRRSPGHHSPGQH
jgi:DMSO reductase anchor subunit